MPQKKEQKPNQQQAQKRRRAKQSRSQSTVDAVITATAHVIEKHGYAKATTDRIAERAGVSVGSVYQYFSNKDEICTQLIEREEKVILHAMQAIRTNADLTAQEQLIAFTELGTAEARLSISFFQELQKQKQFQERLTQLIQDILDEYTLLISSIRPDLPSQRAQEIAMLIVRCGEGIGQTPADLKDSQLLRDFQKMIGRYILNVPA